MQLILNGLISGFSYALVAIGFSLIYSTTRFFHFAHGAAYTIGAYLAYSAVVLFGLNPWLGFVFGIVGASILGLLMELTVYRPLRRFRASPLVLLLASIGIYVVFQNIISLIFSDDTRVLRKGLTEPGLPFLGARITPIQIAIVMTSLCLCAAVWAVLRVTDFGKLLRAVANDGELARIVGINSNRIVLLTFVIGSVLAGVAGILIGYDTDLTPSMGFKALLMGIIVVIVGGVGSVGGAILGGLLLGLVQHFAASIFPTQWQDGIVFLILILFLLMRPEGFFGKPLNRAAA